MDRNEALEEVRKRMRERKGGRVRDPNEFVPPQVKPDEELKYKFIVLPPLQADEQCAGGKASRGMDLWYVNAGKHWINSKPYECPRIHDGVDCPFCQLGFDLLADTDDDDTRKNIVKTYLARSSYVVNIYFPPYGSTPADLRGKVMWYAMPKTVFEIMEGTIMRDASTDELDPQAYGLFYSPDESYVFQLEVRRQGDYNEYKSSKFLPNTRGPMIRTKDGQANTAEIAKVLAMRHDLFTKFAPRDVDALAKRAHEILHGEPDRKNQTTSTTNAAASSASTAAPTKKTTEPKGESKTESNDPQGDALLDEPVDTKAAKKSTSSVSKTTGTGQATKSQAAPAPATVAKKAEPVSEPDDAELNQLLNDIRQNP